MEAKYKRVILKISGEALSSDKENIDFDIVNTVAKQVVEITELGASVGIIVGGGNIWRGRRGKGMDRITACLLYTSEILFGIGPSIGPCCFEVQEDVSGKFREKFGGLVLEHREGRMYVCLLYTSRCV